MIRVDLEQMVELTVERSNFMTRSSSGVSEKQQKIINFLVSFQEKNGYPPTIRQIGAHIDVASTSQVSYYLNQLEKRNLIQRDKNSSRGIRYLEAALEYVDKAVRLASKTLEDILSIPISGRIVASAPIPMPVSASGYYNEDYDTVDVARSMISPKEKLEDLFALEVQGDSMIDALVNDGDIVIMKKAQDAVNGEMVAVWLTDNDETTLKYFYREGGRIRLQPANPHMKPIYIENPAQVRIMGKVVMVVRQIPLAA
jgi:repressor LexA